MNSGTSRRKCDWCICKIPKRLAIYKPPFYFCSKECEEKMKRYEKDKKFGVDSYSWRFPKR